MDERRQQELAAASQLGSEMRDFCQHPGFKVLMKFIQTKVADARNEWLTAPTSQAAEEIRMKAKPYAEIETHLKKLMIEGDLAASNLREVQEDVL